MPTTKEEHLTYLKQKGKFKIDSKIKNLPAFSDEMIDLLEKYGHWFEALEKGILEPISDRQRKFVEAVKNEQPISIEESTWVLYQKRRKLEKGLEEALRRRPSINDNSFYTREDVNKVRGTLFATISKEHRR